MMIGHAQDLELGGIQYINIKKFLCKGIVYFSYLLYSDRNLNAFAAWMALGFVALSWQVKVNKPMEHQN